MRAAHELYSAQLSFFVKVLHIQKLSTIDGGLHKHIVFPASFSSIDDLVQFIDAHSHRDGTGTVLSSVHHLYR